MRRSSREASPALPVLGTIAAYWPARGHDFLSYDRRWQPGLHTWHAIGLKPDYMLARDHLAGALGMKRRSAKPMIHGGSDWNRKCWLSGNLWQANPETSGLTAGEFLCHKQYVITRDNKFCEPAASAGATQCPGRAALTKKKLTL